MGFEPSIKLEPYLEAELINNQPHSFGLFNLPNEFMFRIFCVVCMFTIRPSVDGLCRDGPSEISRDPSTKRLQTRPKRLGWL